jgi:hypothetical protein
MGTRKLDYLVSGSILATICNDSLNHLDYSVVGKECFYKGKMIGTVSSEYNIKSGEFNIYFQPIRPIQHITVKFTITKTGCEFKS